MSITLREMGDLSDLIAQRLWGTGLLDDHVPPSERIEHEVLSAIEQALWDYFRGKKVEGVKHEYR